MGQTLHILPDAGACRQEQRDILSSSPVVLGDPCLTISMLVKTFYASLPRQKHRLSSGGRALLASSLLSRHSEQNCPEIFQLASFPGFSDTLVALFDELKCALVTPNMLERAVASLPGSYLRELAQLYRLHTRQLDTLGILDRYDPDRAVLEHLRSGGSLPEELGQVSAISVSRVHELTPLHRELILELAQRIPLTITLPYDPEEPDAFAGALPLIEALERTGEESPLAGPPNFAPPVGPFIAPLFQGGGQAMLPTGFEVIEAPTPLDEVRWVASRIRRLLEENHPPSDIAILCRDARRQMPMLQEVCKRYRIPLTTTEGSPLGSSPLVHACLAPLAAARDRISRQSLVDMASSTYLRPRQLSLEGSDVETVLREARYIDDGICRAETALGRAIRNRQKRGQETSREEACLTMLRPLLAATRRFSRIALMGEIVPLLNRHIEEFGLYHHAISGGERETVWRDAVATTSFQQILDDLAADISILGMEDTPTTPSLALSIIRQAMTGSRLTGRHRDAVSFLSFEQAAGLTFPHVFVIGLNEGGCPARSPQDPLLSDTLRIALNRHLGSRLLATSGDRAKIEPLLFRFAVASARSSLTLSFSAADESGSELLPSEYLEDILGNHVVTVTRPGRHLGALPLDECHDRQEILTALIGVQDDTTPLAPQLLSIRTTATRDTDIGCACQASTEEHRALLSRDDILSELKEYYSTPPGNIFSPTQLEEYARCPFRFWLQRILGVLPPRELELEPSAADRGSLLHALLHRFFEHASQKGMLPLSGASGEAELLQETAELVFSRWEAETSPPAFLRETEKSRTIALAQAVLAEEIHDTSGLFPVAWEHRFPPLQLTTPAGSSFQLTGIIDRIDSSTDGKKLRVVDYKLSKNKGRYSQLLQQEKMGVSSFQMPAYAAAVAEESKRSTGQQWEMLTMRYWAVRAGGCVDSNLVLEKEGDVFLDCTPEGLMRGEENFFWRVWKVVEKMEAGQFQPTPIDCSMCPFPAICRTAE